MLNLLNCCGSNEADEINQKIEDVLRNYQLKREKQKQILVIGFKSSGISLIFKNLQEIYPKWLSNNESDGENHEILKKENVKYEIQKNLITEMALLITKAISYDKHFKVCAICYLD